MVIRTCYESMVTQSLVSFAALQQPKSSRSPWRTCSWSLGVKDLCRMSTE